MIQQMTIFFTCTLFLAHKGENSFESIVGTASGSDLVNSDPNRLRSNENPPATADGSDSLLEKNPPATADGSDSLLENPPACGRTASDTLLEFFQTNFADAIPLMPSLAEDFFTNPTGNLGTIKCFPWNAGGKALLLGDSAHAVVPFYGQGMNASFEDCRILNQLISDHGTDWQKVFDEFTEIRKPNADAIAEMAEENFYEMRDAVADPIFVRKRELETKLEQTFPDYFSKYSMVTFREDLPYSIARQKGNAQDKLLMEICANVENVSEIDLNAVMEKVQNT